MDRRRTLLVGALNEPLAPLLLDRACVAVMNTAAIAYASQVYASSPDFVWIKPDGEIASGVELLPFCEANA